MGFTAVLCHWLTEMAAFLTESGGVLLFCSIRFWAVFVVFLAGYALLRYSRRGAMMAYVVAFGLFLAFKANGLLMLLLPFTAVATWMLVNCLREAVGTVPRRAWLAFIVVLNFVPLIYFKYANFLGASLAAMVGSNFSPWKIALPVGISFYTFQSVSYVVDVYRGTFRLRPTLLEFLFYLTFFPLLLAGPITRAATLIPQMRRLGCVASHMVWYGVWLFICGLLKKAVCADYLAQFVNLVYDDPVAYSGFENLMATAGYTLQIYLDFSGYSDMAIGLAAMLGFRLRDNFNAPYQSLNVSEFWRRWHISLSTWFRDYLYIPLGGNRKGMARTYANNFLTMVVAGVWHGASWMFVIWGAMHGAALVVHKFCKRLFLVALPASWWLKASAWVLTTVFVMAAWVFFRAPDLTVAASVFARIFTDFDWAYLVPFVQVRWLWCLVMVVAAVCHTPAVTRCAPRLAAAFVCAPWVVKFVVFVCTVQLAVEAGQSTVQPFIYAQF
ncbi:MAG: MBOAT family protein [Bacteroidaceae bacterium]|nr:MBOAT family protein [Bacteroidaceae bacterium]